VPDEGDGRSPGDQSHGRARHHRGLAGDGAQKRQDDGQGEGDAERGGFAIELVLPSYANEGVAVSVAQVVGSALLAERARPAGVPRLERTRGSGVVGAPA
jgi:hypothetical protein